MITFAAITPHPPIIVPGVGHPDDLRKAERTVLAMEKLGQEIEEARPDVIVMISPHAPTDPYSFGVNVKSYLRGDLREFGLLEQFEFKNEPQIGSRIKYAAETNNEFHVHTYENDLDHGMLVPLFYLAQKVKPAVVPLSFSAFDLSMHYDFGGIVGKICSESGKDVAIIASGDLSHRLTPQAPAGYSEHGKEFDRQLINLLSQNAVADIINLKEGFVSEAGECGLRSIVMLLGAIHKQKYHFNEYSYEGPFGVGYLVARLI